MEKAYIIFISTIIEIKGGTRLIRGDNKNE